MKEIKNNVEFDDLDNENNENEETKEAEVMEEKKENIVVATAKKVTENKVVRKVAKGLSYVLAIAAGAAFVLVFGSNTKKDTEVTEYTENDEEYTEE